jgi:glycosyltransferase involved in cell wall biosynthesis
MIRIHYVGLSGFPFGLAAIEKQKLIARGLVDAGADVTVICNRWGNFDSEKLSKSGEFLGVRYYYTTHYTSRPTSFLKRRLAISVGRLIEIFTLFTNKQDIILVSSENFYHIFLYYLIAKIKRKKIFLTYVEDVSFMFSSSGLNKIKIKLFDRYIWKILDGAFPISEYLMDKVNKANPSLPKLKLPTIVDFGIFMPVEEKKTKYFLFCGAANYYEVIAFIIEAFEKVPESDYKLFLVSNGSEADVLRLKNRISASSKRTKIELFGFLNYRDLINLYLNASGLLIPLRNNVRDLARFPHKIGEYCASRVPILSTDYGEIHFYFKHLESALLAKEYNSNEFAGLMEFVVNNPEVSFYIGTKSRLIGEKYFEYKSKGKEILEFMMVN